MKLTAEEFMNQPQKAITLIGMSGAGKSHISTILEKEGWYNYSCDGLMGAQYLEEIAEKDISINAYIGRLGNPALGGMDREEFARRQKLHYDAECAVLRDMVPVLQNNSSQSFINDSSGSLCEIEDEDVLAAVGQHTLVVYLKISQEDHGELLARALSDPKSLYFPTEFFEEHLNRYKNDFDVSQVEEIDPDEFLRWIFPYLFKARLPKYQKLADQYGVSVNVSDLKDISSEEDFLNCIARALGE